MSSSTLRKPAFLLLTALAGRPQHGYTLIEDIGRLSGGRVRLRTGTLYALLERLRAAGLIELDREEVVASRLRRYYRLSSAGATALSAESEMLRRQANAADGLLRQRQPGPGTAMLQQAGSSTATSTSAWSNLAVTPRSDRFSHHALFYRNADEYLAGTLQFVMAGLDAGEPVAAAVPTDNLQVLRDGLGQRASQVHLLDMTTIGRNPGRIIPAVLLAFADRHAGKPVRIIGEPIWPARTAAEYPARVQHEALINLAFVEYRATILCPYDSTNLTPRALRDAARTHPTLHAEAGTQTSDLYAPRDAYNDYNLPLPDDEIKRGRVYNFNAATLALARALAVTHADHLGLPANRLSDVELVVAELAMNSIHYGGGGGRLVVGIADEHVVCQVQDEGTLTDPLAGRRPFVEGQSGRGLLTVNRAADLVRTHAAAGSTTIRADFRIGPL